MFAPYWFVCDSFDGEPHAIESEDLIPLTG
jgi:hypothetical protein